MHSASGASMAGRRRWRRRASRRRICCAGRFQLRVGRAAARRLLGLADRVTAIIASNDQMSLATLDVAREFGFRVPDDLSVSQFRQHADRALHRAGSDRGRPADRGHGLARGRADHRVPSAAGRPARRAGSRSCLRWCAGNRRVRRPGPRLREVRRGAPDGTRRFLWLFALAWAGGAIAYVPFLTILLPLRVVAIAGEDSVRILGIMTFFGAIAASGGNIVFGWLSDRSGTRRPWIAAGLLLSQTLLVLVSLEQGPVDDLALVVCWQLAPQYDAGAVVRVGGGPRAAKPYRPARRPDGPFAGAWRTFRT